MRAISLFQSLLFRRIFFVTFLAAAIPGCLLSGYALIFSSDSLTTLSGWGLVSAFACVLLPLLASFYLGKTIVRPIDSFVHTATQVARGEVFNKVSETSKDEIGRLARLFNYIVEDLRINKKRKVSERLREKFMTQKILENISDGVVLTDSDERVSLVNPVAKTWFGMADHSVEDEALDKVLSHGTLVDFIKHYSVDFGNKRGHTEISLETSDGWKSRVIQAKAAQIANTDSNELGYVVTVLRDITREKEIDRLKTELVSMVAHELRSPLTCISGFSELLMDSSITRHQAEEYANIILKETNRLNDLINKFLDISKIEAGKSQLQKSPVDMKMLIQKVLDFNRQLAEKKEIKVKFVCPKEVPSADFDRDMIEQAILNLFSNAVKYSPDNASVTIRLFEVGDNVCVEVKDTGYGISEKSLQHVFEKFYRVTDNEKVYETRGTGLGLPLVKQIVEAHSGSVQVNSMLNEGSTFMIKLPRMAGPVQEVSEALATEDDPV